MTSFILGFSIGLVTGFLLSIVGRQGDSQKD
jgi:hypothetical protein